jgi:FkbM family methyltransferase
MVVDTGDVIGRSLVVSGVWEPEVTRVFKDVLSPGDVCVDVGANIGYFTLLASRLVGPSGRVYAVEPSSIAYAALLANLERNAISNVVPLRVAAGAREGNADLRDPPPGNLGSASLLEAAATRGSSRPARGVTRVPVVPLSALLGQEDRHRVKLVKIDVEGFELEVLVGLEPMIDAGASPVIVVELNLAIWPPEARTLVTGICARHGLRPFSLSEEAADGRGRRPARVPVDIENLVGDQIDLLLAPSWLTP